MNWPLVDIRFRVVSSDIGIPKSLERDSWIDREGVNVWYTSTRPWHRVTPYYMPA